jgi:hypothetical protein
MSQSNARSSRFPFDFFPLLPSSRSNLEPLPLRVQVGQRRSPHRSAAKAQTPRLRQLHNFSNSPLTP